MPWNLFNLNTPGNWNLWLQRLSLKMSTSRLKCMLVLALVCTYNNLNTVHVWERSLFFPTCYWVLEVTKEFDELQEGAATLSFNVHAKSTKTNTSSIRKRNVVFNLYYLSSTLYLFAFVTLWNTIFCMLSSVNL